MSAIDAFSGQDLTIRRTGAAYLKLYHDLRTTAERMDNAPEDWLTRGGEVSLVDSQAGRTFSLSYQRADVIARESLILHREDHTPQGYQAQSLELGQDGELLKVTHRLDSTRDVFGDEAQTILYVDPGTGELFSPR